MDRRGKDLLLENLAAAAVLGVMALLVSSLSFVFDRLQDSRDAASLVAFSGAASIQDPVRVPDPAFSRVYTMTRRGRTFYASIADLSCREGVARVAFVFARDGSLDSAGLVESVPEGLAFGQDGWFNEFLGKGGNLPFPAAREELRKADAVSGATESFETTSAVLGRLSAAVSHIAVDAGRSKD